MYIKLSLFDLEKHRTDAKLDDFVYTHYIDHGEKATTIVPELNPGNSRCKDRLEIDEALIPIDFSLGGRCFSGMELTSLLKRIVDNGRHVLLSSIAVTRMIWEETRPKSRTSQGFDQNEGLMTMAEPARYRQIGYLIK